MNNDLPPCVSNQYFKKTRRGRVLRVVRERYLRDDIGYGTISSAGYKNPTKLTGEDDLIKALSDEYTDERGRPVLLVVDTNIVVGQLTALETDCPAIRNVLLCETVLSETVKLKMTSKDRLLSLIRDGTRSWVVFANEHHRDTYDERQAGETPNDHNDRLVRRAAQYFASKLSKKAKVILLTDDADSLVKLKDEEKSQKSGLIGMRMVQFAESIQIKYPRFIESVARRSFKHKVAQSLALRPNIFKEHLSLAQLEDAVKNGRLFQGNLRSKVARHCNDEDEAAVLVFGLEGKGEEATRVSIVGMENLNRAVEGDRVAIEILSEEESRMMEQKLAAIAKATGSKASSATEEKTDEFVNELAEDEEEENVKATRYGRVIGIMKKSWRACVGTLVEDLSGLELTEDEQEWLSQDKEDDEEESTVVFYPMDVRLPPMLVQTRRIDQLKLDRVVCQMDSWDARSRFPTAHFVKSLGPIGDKDTETASVLFEHDIPTAEFSPAVLGCLPKQGKNWTAEDESPFPSWRVDLRAIDEVCSVDPPGCKDIDDALHCRLSPNDPSRLEVGVHIADVSHFVLPGTPIDLEARHRGTSTYLVERRLDMLPGLLTTDICSLVGHKDRFCFSVIWETNLTGTEFIGEPRFFKSCIRSRGALTYDQAQTMIMADKATDVTSQSIRRLNMIAKVLRARRIANGALTLASQEVRFELDEETQDPTSVKKYVQKDAHHMVEEFMLLANCAVAEKIERTFPRKALLRRHPRPSPEMLQELVASGRAAGIELDVSSSKALADSLDAAEREGQPMFNQILRIVTTRAMQQAQYFCTGYMDTRQDFLHYGLAVPVYTHFTSPIRRYADLVVHRMLGAAIGLHPMYEGYERREDVKMVADNLNKRHKNAQRAGRASAAVHTVVLFRSKPPMVVDAYVSGISALRVNVMIPEFGLEEVLSGAEGEVDKKTMSIVLSANKRKLTIFDKVKVKLYVETVGPSKRQRLVVELFEPTGGVESDDKSHKRIAAGSVDSSENKRVKSAQANKVESVAEKATEGLKKKKQKMGN